jgi:hypothetical protein
VTGLIEANAGRQAAEAWRGRIFDATAKETTRRYGEGEEGGAVSGPPVFDRERGKEPGRGEAARASPKERVVTAPSRGRATGELRSRDPQCRDSLSSGLLAKRRPLVRTFVKNPALAKSTGATCN